MDQKRESNTKFLIEGHISYEAFSVLSLIDNTYTASIAYYMVLHMLVSVPFY